VRRSQRRRPESHVASPSTIDELQRHAAELAIGRLNDSASGKSRALGDAEDLAQEFDRCGN
jgi:hypothetical protein